MATDDVGANAVTLAAFHGRGDVIDFILDSTEVAETDGAALALLTWPTRKGETPLMAAARGGRADVVRLLARRMAPHAPPGLDGDGGGYWDGGGDARERTAAALAARGGTDGVPQGADRARVRRERAIGGAVHDPAHARRVRGASLA